MEEKKHKIKGLGEIVLRAQSVETLVNFYRDVVGLKIIPTSYEWTFFEIAEGHGGYTQTLAICSADSPLWNDLVTPDLPDPAKSTIHHFSFNLLADDFVAEVKRLTDRNVRVQMKDHADLGWRSAYFLDPEGNTFEFVCYMDAVRSAKESQ